MTEPEGEAGPPAEEEQVAAQPPAEAQSESAESALPAEAPPSELAPPEADSDDDEDSASMSFGSHLDELRRRVIISIAVTFVAFLACFSQSNMLMAVVLQPVLDTLTELGLPARLIATGPTETFMAHLKLSLVAAMFFASPVVLYQAWAFVGAGLFAHERRYVMTFLPVSIISFIAGVLFFHFTVLPFGLKFLLNYGGGADGIEPLIKVSEHISFCLLLALIMGVIFQLPLAMLFAIKIGVVTPDQLAEHRRMAILLGFVGGAMLTPPDAITQVCMAVPLALLYEVGIVVGRVGTVKQVEGEEQTRINLRGVGMLFLPTLVICVVVAYTLHTQPPVQIRGAGMQRASETFVRKLHELGSADPVVWTSMARSRNPLIRFEAYRLLATLPELPLLLETAMVEEPDPALQIEAASLVAHHGNAEQRGRAVTRLIALIETPVGPRYAYLAHLELCKISGTKVPIKVWPDDAARAASVAHWRKWWSEQPR